MQTKIPTKLQKVYTQIENCPRCKAEKNPLLHVLGGGKLKNPKFCFLFINPTHRNRSSHESYEGTRSFPFIGVRHLYKGLSEAGFVDEEIIKDFYNTGWQVGDEHRIEKSLKENNVYVSNFVKCAQPHPINPPRRVMREELKNLAEEFRAVNPEYIVTMGLPQLETLTGEKYRLKDILKTVPKTYAPIESKTLPGKQYKILPSYFPIGHGNPPKAHKILTHIKKNF